MQSSYFYAHEKFSIKLVLTSFQSSCAHLTIYFAQNKKITNIGVITALPFL